MQTDKKRSKDGIDREFDIFWQFNHMGSNYSTVVECKNHNRPVDVQAIDAFVGKLAGFPSLKGIFVSRSGFSKNAVKAADRNGVELIVSRQASDFDFDGRVQILKVKLVAISVPRVVGIRAQPIDPQYLGKNLLFTNFAEIYVDKAKYATLQSLADKKRRNVTALENETIIERFPDQNAVLRDNTGTHEAVELAISEINIDIVHQPNAESEVVMDFADHIEAIIESFDSSNFKYAVLRNGGLAAF
ncbi:restriction endonuclease [Gammaproteobacteria bacterium]|nr:restriction endonuclease [Gammaproteobacteria bacterium]